MLKITKWTLTLCPCVIFYEWEAELSETERRHVIKDFHFCGQSHPCPVNGDILEDSEFFSDYIKRMEAFNVSNTSI